MTDWVAAVKANDLIDVYRENEWKTARVVAITESQFRCEFVKQWGGRVQREFIRKTSDRLAAAGTHVTEDATQAQAAPAGSPAGASGGGGGGGQIQRQELVQGFGMTLNVNDKCDCLDREKWRGAEIIAMEGDNLRIHFVGWAPKWDEWVNKRSSRLQPHNSQTGGLFTGDPKLATQGGGAIPEGFFDAVVVDNTPKQWKRVLSHGLSDPQVKVLDGLFEKACKLQDAQRAIVLGRQQDTTKLQKDLADLKTDLAKSVEGLPTMVKPYLQICGNIVSDIKATLWETTKQKRRQELQKNEVKYFQRLHKDFYFVKIPSDGNCLFGATGRGYKFGKQIAACSHNGEVKAVVHEARKLTVDDSSNIATDFRLQAIMHLQTDLKYRSRIVSELQHAVQTGMSGKGNPTSKVIVQQLKAAFKGQDLMKAVETKQAINIYCQVMMEPRFFGTELEVQALSEILKTPLHLYYRVTNECDTKEGEIKATKIIGREYAEEGVPPVHLAFYMGKSHYDLLVKKHHKPDPEEEKKRAEREKGYKEEGFNEYKLEITKCRSGADAKAMQISQVRFFQAAGWLMAPPPKNPGGQNPRLHEPVNIIDGCEESKIVDLKFKENKKSDLIFDFGKPVKITHYELCYAKDQPEHDPVSWAFYGKAADGWRKLDEEIDCVAKAEDRAKPIKLAVAFFGGKEEGKTKPEGKEGKVEGEGKMEGGNEEKKEGGGKGDGGEVNENKDAAVPKDESAETPDASDAGKIVRPMPGDEGASAVEAAGPAMEVEGEDKRPEQPPADDSGESGDPTHSEGTDGADGAGDPIPAEGADGTEEAAEGGDSADAQDPAGNADDLNPL